MSFVDALMTVEDLVELQIAFLSAKHQNVLVAWAPN
jgi:hypothetical protein